MLRRIYGALRWSLAGAAATVIMGLLTGQWNWIFLAGWTGGSLIGLFFGFDRLFDRYK